MSATATIVDIASSNIWLGWNFVTNDQPLTVTDGPGTTYTPFQYTAWLVLPSPHRIPRITFSELSLRPGSPERPNNRDSVRVTFDSTLDVFENTVIPSPVTGTAGHPMLVEFVGITAFGDSFTGFTAAIDFLGEIDKFEIFLHCG